MSIYNKYKTHEIWEILDQAVKDLEQNSDIEITTNRDYVIGYIAKEIIDNKEKSKK